MKKYSKIKQDIKSYYDNFKQEKKILSDKHDYDFLKLLEKFQPKIKESIFNLFKQEIQEIFDSYKGLISFEFFFWCRYLDHNREILSFNVFNINGFNGNEDIKDIIKNKLDDWLDKISPLIQDNQDFLPFKDREFFLATKEENIIKIEKKENSASRIRKKENN